jgi:uncharacterized membrane protein (GlpM family)
MLQFVSLLLLPLFVQYWFKSLVPLNPQNNMAIAHLIVIAIQSITIVTAANIVSLYSSFPSSLFLSSKPGPSMFELKYSTVMGYLLTETLFFCSLLLTDLVPFPHFWCS